MAKYFLLILGLSAGINSWAIGQNPQHCIQIEAQLKRTVAKLNKMFQMDVTVTFVETVSYFGQTRKARLLDSSAAHQDSNGKETLQFPKPCSLEEQLPANEFWDILAAHEFSHKILDPHIHTCSSVSDEVHGKVIFGESVQLYNLNHLNVYLMSLKILKHLNLNGKKAATEFGNWAVIVARDLDEDSAKAITGIAEFLNSKWPTTSFNTGKDFTTGEYFDIDGLNILNKFLKSNYPNSTLVNDVKKQSIKQIGSCLMFKTEDVAAALFAWKRSIGIP